MKATLEFNLPEDHADHLAAVHGMDWKLVAWNMQQILMRVTKHEIPTTAEQMLEHLMTTIEDKGLSLED